MKLQCSKCYGWYANIKGLRTHFWYCKEGNDNATFQEEEYLSSGLKEQSSDIGLKNQTIHPDADIYPTAAKS